MTAGAAAQIERLRRRHRDFYLELAEKAGAHIYWHGRWVDSAEEPQWLNVLSQEHDNVRSAIRWSLDQGEIVQALRFCIELGGYWSQRRYLAEGRRCVGEAIERADDVSEDLVADALVVAGRLAFDDGDFAAARSLQRRALQMRRAVADARNEVHALIDLGWTEAYDGSKQEFAPLAREALALARRIDEPYVLARALFLALWAERDDDHPALERLDAELRNLEPQLPVRVCLDQAEAVAERWRDAGRLDRAAETQRRQLPMVRELADPEYVAYALGSLGEIEREIGDTSRAAAFLEEALSAARAHGDDAITAHILSRLAAVALDEGRYGTAEVLVDEALETQRRLPGAGYHDTRVSWALMETREEAALAGGDGARARDLVGRRVEDVRRGYPEWHLVNALEGQIRIAMLTGDYAMAVAGCREAIEIGSKDLTDDDRRWHHARLQGWLAALEGRFEDAIRHHTEQLSHGREGGYVQREGQSLTDLARMQLVADEVDVAVENLRKATDSAAETGQTDLHLQAALLLSEAERRQGGYASARARLRSLVEATTVWKVPHSIELVEVVARLAASTDHLGIAVKLAGAAQAAREQTGMPALPHGSANRSLLEEAIRRMDELDEVWREGSALTLDEARAEAFVYLGA